MKRLGLLLGGQSDLILVVFMVGILVVLFTPIPTELLDLLLIANFCFGLTLLLLTFYTARPLEFSTFPSLLLIATLFRLSLNIAATRLILSDGDAGKVIGAIGDYVVGGNYVIGLIVFLVLIVVQYVVVTNGAQRVAEVAARFTLDSMPGKQLSIDADLNIGLIDEEEARRRRREIERESNFYGAMDGASKFVKGDAIAGIIIILIDIIGGLIVGVAQMGMSWGQSAQTFTLLTVGDGIVTQIPALVIATATGIIVTRAASDDYLSKEIGRQVTAYPKSLVVVATGLVIFLFLPGIPAVPVLFLLAVIAALLVYITRGKATEAAEVLEAGRQKLEEGSDLYEMLAVDPIELRLGKGLVPMAGGDESPLMDRIVAFRKQYALDMGFVIPKVRIRDNARLEPNAYELRIGGAKTAEGVIAPDRVLAIDPGGATHALEGQQTKDPTYGLPAVWIAEESAGEAREAGYTVVEPLLVLMTHLSEVIKRESANLLTRAETERLLDRMKETHRGLAEELVPDVLSLSDIQKVLQRLLNEQVSIRNFEAILEVLVDAGKQNKDPDVLTELVRQRLGAIICDRLIGNRDSLYVLTLDPSIEHTMAKSVRSIQDKNTMVLEPQLAEKVLAKMAGSVERMLTSNYMPVLLCAPELRAHVRRLTERIIPHLAVLSLAEVPNNVSVKSFGLVSA